MRCCKAIANHECKKPLSRSRKEHFDFLGARKAHKHLTHQRFLPPFATGLYQGQTGLPLCEGENLGLSLGQPWACLGETGLNFVPGTNRGSSPSASGPKRSCLCAFFLSDFFGCLEQTKGLLMVVSKRWLEFLSRDFAIILPLLSSWTLIPQFDLCFAGNLQPRFSNHGLQNHRQMFGNNVLLTHSSMKSTVFKAM